MSNDVSVIDVAALKVIKIDPGRRVALGRRDLAAMSDADGPRHAREPPRCRSTASAIPMARARRSMTCRFDVAPASFAVLLGLNGAGKSTLFSLITRLYAIRAGSIRIFGHDVERAARRGACAGSASCSSRARSTSI